MTQNLHHERLVGVHPNLIAVFHRAVELCPIAIMVVEGVRTDEQAYVNFGKGRSAEELKKLNIDAKYAKPDAAKVTWLKDPLNTKHRKQRDGFGHALDLLPAPFDWKDTKPFDVMAKAMLAAARELGIAIRWGADWDADGKPRERGETDSPHFELVR